MTHPLTFFFNDLEDSTSLWEQFPEQMKQAASRYDTLIHAVIEQHQGRVVKTTEDRFNAVFDSSPDGIDASCRSANDQLRNLVGSNRTAQRPLVCFTKKQLN